MIVIVRLYRGAMAVLMRHTVSMHFFVAMTAGIMAVLVNMAVLMGVRVAVLVRVHQTIVAVLVAVLVGVRVAMRMLVRMAMRLLMLMIVGVARHGVSRKTINFSTRSLAHAPQKWKPVLRKGHARTKI
jgi:hypothetical protein